MNSHLLRIATRKSPLARWQAEHVRERLEAAHPGLAIELVLLTTQGDKILDTPLARVGGKGLFVKELERAMLAGEADIAVHSMKDVPAELPEGLHLPVVLTREDPRDAFVSHRFSSFDELPTGARVGTSSLRRRCQLCDRRPELEVLDLRGNVNTRLKKLAAGEYDALVLAAAGLKRLGLTEHVREWLEPTVSLPAIGQGAIGIECRADDPRINGLVAPLNDAQTLQRITAERALNRRLGGGCQVPIAGYAEIEGDRLRLRALVGRPDGSEVVRGEVQGAPDEGERLGTTLAEDLLGRGAAAILRDLYA